VEELENLHKTLAKLQIKRYKLKIISDGLGDHDCIKPPLFENLLHQLAQLQCLESLGLEVGQLKTAEPFKIILGGFPELKTLEISLLEELPALSTFPFEDLIHLKSIKKLVLLFAEFNRRLILKRLPKIFTLDDIRIGSISYSEQKAINSDDYRIHLFTH